MINLPKYFQDFFEVLRYSELVSVYLEISNDFMDSKFVLEGFLKRADFSKVPQKLKQRKNVYR
jgi:hypothetical protein